MSGPAASDEHGRRAGTAPLRVLMLTGFPAIGGPLPKLAPLVADGLRREGCEVVVEGWSAHTAQGEGLLRKLTGRSLDLLRVLRRIRAWRPDVVYVATSHNWPALLRDLPLALTVPRGRPPLVVHFHGSECDKLGRPGQALFTAASRLLVGRLDTVLVLSTEELEAWRAFAPGARFELVDNPFVPPEGAAAAAEAAPGHEVPTVLFIGRLVREKGVHELLEAFERLRRERPCRLLVAGIGPEREAMERRAAAAGLDGDVTFLGYVRDAELAAAYRSADVFALPSYREGFPLVVPEAMAYGLPVVTTPIRGCADHLVDGENGLFAAPRDVEGLAAGLRRLLDDPGLRRRMGAANVAGVRRFSPEAVVPRYAELLRGAAARSCEQPPGDGGVVRILAAPVRPLCVADVAALAARWAADGAGRFVCAANVHMVMEAHDDPSFAAVLKQADLVHADGRPLVWACRLRGVRQAHHARGLDVMLRTCAVAQGEGLRVGVYGGEPELTDALVADLHGRYPGLAVTYSCSPPFRELTPAEDDEIVRAIGEAGVQLLLVGLGCPKQERWMLAHRDRLGCTMLGVGAAFSMATGRLPVAPVWMQRAGLEWAHRLTREPRRLWRRYARHNLRFLVLAGAESLRARRRPGH